MAGKMCFGKEYHNAARPRDTRAYCEGRAVKAAGGAVADNPLQTGSETSDAWLAGWHSATADKGCCAA